MSDQKIVKMLQAPNGALVTYNRAYIVDSEKFKIVFCKLNPETNQLEIVERKDALSDADVAADIAKETESNAKNTPKPNKGVEAERNAQKASLSAVSIAPVVPPAATATPTKLAKKVAPPKKVKVAATTPTEFDEEAIPSSLVE